MGVCVTEHPAGAANNDAVSRVGREISDCEGTGEMGEFGWIRGENWEERGGIGSREEGKGWDEAPLGEVPRTERVTCWRF